jgi:hypothetical protein
MNSEGLRVLHQIHELAKQAVLTVEQTNALSSAFRLAFPDIVCMHLINAIREREGWCIEIIGDNPDFDMGPNCIIEVFGEWKTSTGAWSWCEQRFEGESLLKCLTDAHDRILAQCV